VLTPESIVDLFESYIRTYDLFSDEEVAIIKSLAIPKYLKKKQYLLRQGSVCRYHTFICSGCLRSYRIDDGGCEHIIGLSPANQWVSDPVSLLSGKPSNDFIDALEDSTFIQFSTISFKTLLADMPGFNELNNRIIKDEYNIARDRIYMMLSLHAEERYRQFIRIFPGLHDRIPVYMIASYLGVSRETLTRIRSNILEL
jgi:CRP-like cAMP-binding protein